MEQFIGLVAAVQAHPILDIGIGAVVAVAIGLLRRKPKLQRDADARLSALRRDKADQYTSLRPPH